MSATTPRALTLIDCTLREGEQTAGVWFSRDEKLELVGAFARAGITLLDAGMPAVSEDERGFLAAATGLTSARIGASVRALDDEVRLAANTGCDEMFVICPVSEGHRARRLGLSEDAFLTQIGHIVALVRRLGRTANVVCEDASRAEAPALRRAIAAAVDAGTERVFLCDTVGVWTPSRAAAVVRAEVEAFPGITMGVHCHDDLGMATANTIAAIEAGASAPTATVNGVGERAGNASLAEVAAAVELLLGIDTGFQLSHAVPLSHRVEALTGFIVPPNAPLVGWNAYRHESGIHVDGILKSPETYEALSPERVGRGHRFTAGKHSGRAWLRRFAEVRRLSTDDVVVAAVLDAVKSERPPNVRPAFRAVREALDAFHHAHLGVPEARLVALFEAAARGHDV